MAACPPHLLPRLHLRPVSSASSRGSPRLFIPCDHPQILFQASTSRVFLSACASSSICLHEDRPIEIRVSGPSSRVIEPSISSDFLAREASLAQCRLDASAGYKDEWNFAESSAEHFLDRKASHAFLSDEACTSCSGTDAHILSLAGARLPGEASLLNETCCTSYSMPEGNASLLRVSLEAAESPQNLSSASTASSQTRDRSKVVRTAWEALVRWSRSWQLVNARKATNVLQRTRKVVVIGGGSFGTAMAVLLARNKAEMQVSLLLRDSSLCESINNEHINRKYFPKHNLPHNIVATINPQEAFKGSEFCIHAVPVQYSAEFLKSISEHVPSSLPFFSVSKGLELSSLEMMSQVIPRALGNQRQPIAVISGPSFSIELMDELPTALVVASKDKELARAAQQLLASRYLRINTSSDVVGVEIAGALKNVLAIAAGIVEGMNLGNNCMAALVAQGCSEIRWLAEKMGAKSTTLAGLSGTGDIMLTCFVNLSRNRSVGVRLGSGESLSHILSSMNQVAEGVATAGAVIALARKYRVQMPVLTAVARILENELTPKKAVLELMSLPQVEEV